MSCYSKSVSLFASQRLICEECLEVNAFWYSEYQAQFFILCHVKEQNRA